jgi:hypothetical protein
MFDIEDIRILLKSLLEVDGSVDIFKNSIDAYADTKNVSEFDFLISRSNSVESMSSVVNAYIDIQSDRKSAHDIHRSELWRRAVISATDVKHSDPMSFADKVLSHYDEKFNIK